MQHICRCIETVSMCQLQMLGRSACVCVCVCKCESADDAACGMWEGSWQAAVGVAVKAVDAAEARWLLEFLEPRQMEKKTHTTPCRRLCPSLSATRARYMCL